MDASVGGGIGGGDGDGDRTPQRPRIDAGDVIGDVVPPCDAFDPDACGGAEKCDLVVRLMPSPTDPNATVGEISTGCVAELGGRQEGSPCLPWNNFDTPYLAPGLFDEVHVDPCDQGLICAPDPDISGLNTCQRSCQSGLFAQNGFRQISCEQGEYCEMISGAAPDPFREVCKPARTCDPQQLTDCADGLTCALRLASAGIAIVTECQVQPPEPTPVGEACELTNECEKGALCWGPARSLPDSWSSDNVQCRQVCTPGGASGSSGDAGTDAGAMNDEDSGAPTADAGDGGAAGGCPAGTRCVALEDSGLDFSLIPQALGQCE